MPARRAADSAGNRGYDDIIRTERGQLMVERSDAIAG